MKKIVLTCLALSISLFAYAGGNPEFVPYPEGYKTEFTQYDTRNRANGKQVAIMYANQKAIDTASLSGTADGAIIVMEIYKTVNGEDGNPVVGANGLFEKGKFAAVAVMEKRSDWSAEFSADERAGGWGFAIYKPDGTPKENDLDCASCHKPMPDNDYMFSFSSLTKFVEK